jgi:hypothetical protein
MKVYLILTSTGMSGSKIYPEMSFASGWHM